MCNSCATESAAGHWLLPSSAAAASSSSSSSHHHHHHHQGILSIHSPACCYYLFFSYLVNSNMEMVAGRWFQMGEEDSPKKRWGSSTEGADEAEKLIMTKQKKENARERRMIEKNYFDEENEETEEEKDGSDECTELVKKKGNGRSTNSSSSGGGASSSVMEGSRCSRVNGRGWRCCQQTLVGYALCEHHLGKGRLRSMVSVRSRSSSATVDDEGSLLSLPCKRQREDGDEGGLEENLMVMKEKKRNKRKRMGTVKARSISSLLGQTNHAAAAGLTAAPTTAIALASKLSSCGNN